MIGWQFAQDPHGWEWHRLGEDGQFDMRRSPVFPSLLECLADAAKNGYSMSVPAGNAAPNRRFAD